MGKEEAELLEYVCVLTNDFLVLGDGKSVLQYIISFMFFVSLFFSILWKNVDSFSVESVTEVLVLKIVRAFFEADTIRNSSLIVLGHFCLFHRLTAFPFLKYPVSVLRHVICRYEELIYKPLKKLYWIIRLWAD